MKPSYGSALVRFWWLIVLGILLAGVAGAAVIISERDQRTYLASGRLLVTSEAAPHFRIAVNRFVEVPQPTDSSGNGGDDETAPVERAPVLVTDTPDTKTLTQAANLYPLLIESDQVEEARTRMFGDLPGTLTARAIFAVATPGRFEPSDVPVIELIAEADTASGAIALARDTSKAFIKWISDQQEKAGLQPNERIVVQEIHNPSTANTTGGTPVSLVAVVALAILGAFVALAIALARLLPKPARVVEPPVARSPEPRVEGREPPPQTSKS
jgi:hypothetical protein